MRPVERLFLGGIVLVSVAGGYAAGRVLFRPVARVTQPIAFDHKKHAGDLGIECRTCHEYYETGDHAGLPMLSTCMVCHESPQTDRPEEQKVRDLAGAGSEDVFRKLFRMPDHVFYSHRRHVAIGGLPCETCHGAIAATTAPPERPLRRITMDFCIDCHQLRNVATDCTRCHR
jgi:hypothetical protein